jgi:uncharacterized protein YceK
MRKILVSLAILILVSGCATRQRVEVGFRGGSVYDGYYDGYYGSFNDGYWGNDGYFWYSGRDRVWHRDEGRHFRRDSRPGFDHVRGRGGPREH